MSTPPPLDAADAFIRGGSQRLRVLVAAATPLMEQEPLHLRREWQALCRELGEGSFPAALVRLLPPSRETLVDTLERAAAAQVPVHVLHFAGHGEKDHLLFETALGETFRYGGAALADDLRGRGVRLVFLNACDSAPDSALSIAGHLVASGTIDAAIGHSDPVSDEAALLFSSLLYRELCKGERLRDAFEAARSALGARFSQPAQKTRLFGDGDLRFVDLGANTPQAAISFDGTSGRGNMPEVPQFFGRSDEILTIGRFIQATDKRVLAISGLGGIGKTSLALESAARHAWRFPGGLAFSSARTQALGEPTADSLLHAVMAALMPPLAPPEVGVEHLLSYLQARPGLLVFDQLESLSASELQRLVRILERIPPNGSKAILTLRTAPQLLRGWPWLHAMTLTTGLSSRAGRAYVIHAARARELGLTEGGKPHDKCSQDLPGSLTQFLGGHPMLLDLVVDIAATRGVSVLESAVSELSRVDGAVAGGPVCEAIGARMDTLFESVSPPLGVDGRWVLSFFPCSKDGTFTRDELHAAARGAERVAGRLSSHVGRVTAGLASCLKAGLVEHEPHADIYRVHPIVRWHVSRREPRHGTDTALELIEHCLAYVAARLHDHDALGRRLPFLLGSFERAWDADIPIAFREPILSAMKQMSAFFMNHVTESNEISDWMNRLEEQRGESLAERADRLYRQSEVLFTQGELAKSKRCVMESIACYRELTLPEGLAIALEHLAHLEVHQGNLLEARRAVDECLELLRTVNNPATEVAALFDLSNIEMRAGRLPEARAFLLKALEKQKKSNPVQGRGRIGAMMMMLGIATSSLGNHEEGRGLIEQGQALVNALDNPIGNAASLLLLAQSEATQGNFVKARALLSQASETRMSDGRPEAIATALIWRATLERQMGQFSQAQASLLGALKRFGVEAHPNERALILNELAGLYISQGLFSPARQQLDESMKLQQRTGDELNRARSLRYLSMIEYQAGDYTRARAYAEEALALDTALGFHLGRPTSLYQLGLIEAHLRQDTKAEEHLRESLRLMETLNNRQGRAAPLITLAQVEARQGRQDEARKHLQEVITLLDGTGDPQIHLARDLLMKLDVPQARGGAPASTHPDWLSTLRTRTESLIRVAQPERALALIRAAISTHGSKNGPGPLVELHALEGEALGVAGQSREALDVLDKAVAIAKAAGLHEPANRICELRQRIQRLSG